MRAPTTEPLVQSPAPTVAPVITTAAPTFAQGAPANNQKTGDATGQGDAIASLSASRIANLSEVLEHLPFLNHMLRLILLGAGRTIMHEGKLCEVVETRDRLRQLLPLVNEDLREAKPSPFWVPRPRNRKEMRDEQVRRQYISGRRPPFNPPHWTGDARPEGEVVQLETRAPSATSSGAYSSLLAGVTFTPRALRTQMRGLHLVGVPASRTTQGFFSLKTVERAMSKMRTHFGMKAAIQEVVIAVSPPPKSPKRTTWIWAR